MSEELNLDELIINDGTPLDETTTTIVSGSEVTDIIDDMVNYVSEQEGIIPGAPMETIKADDVALSKDEAENAIIESAAMEKLKRETEAYKKLDDDKKLMDFLFTSELQRFRMNYGYEMAGQQKRRLKRDIERGWKSGKYRSWKAKHGDDVLYELNKASNTLPNNSTDNKQPVTSASDIIMNTIK